MKKLLAIVLVVAMITSLSACSVSNSSSSSTSSANTESKSDAKTESKADSKAESKAADATKDSGTLGDYTVAIESARLSKSYDSKPVVVVKYKFTNNGDKTISFAAAIMGKAFQDGVELETSVIGDDKLYNVNNYMKEIKKGASLEVECVYALANQKSKIEVEATELISMSDEKLTKDFDATKLK